MTNQAKIAVNENDSIVRQVTGERSTIISVRRFRVANPRPPDDTRRAQRIRADTANNLVAASGKVEKALARRAGQYCGELSIPL